MLHSICQEIWKTQQSLQDWKISVINPIPKKSNAKEYSNSYTITLFSHASTEMLKIVQARLQQYMHWEFPDVQVGFRKDGGSRDKDANICWVIEKAREFQKKTTSVSSTTLKPLTVQIKAKCGKFWKRWWYKATFLASWENYMQVTKQQLELNMQWRAGSKSGSE